MTNDTKHIPHGYKSSPLGPIPEDWEVKRLGEIGDFSKGNGVPKDKIIKDEHGHPCLTYGDLYTKYDFVIKDIKSFIDDDVASESKEIHIGDICFAGSGETPEDIGKCAAYIEKRTAYAGGDIIILAPNKNINSIWLSYVLNYDIGGKQRYKFAQGFSIVHIYPDYLKQIQIPTPTFTEQNSIVSVLSPWDTAIAKQTALIEKLALRKRGLMQQLLTGKKRLKGFEGEWKEVRLGDVASINRGGSPRPIEDYITQGEGYNWIKIGDVDQDAKYITSTEEKIIKEGLSKTRFVKRGDFILSNSMSFGRPYILKIDGCIHDGWLVIQEYDQTFNIDFLYYILGYDTTLAQYKSMAAGSGVLNLNKEIVKEVQLRIPTIEEQIAIASILINADKEIEIQKQKLAVMQEQKNGLMQVLLTGRKRINK
jgi:type I restriction enzyme S subunit